MERYLIAIATYNERENLPKLVEALFAEADVLSGGERTFEILVIDDDSPDGTGAWCDSFAQSNGRLHCLHRPRRSGLGTAVLDAMRYAVEHSYDRLINMDADFSHHPKYLRSLCDPGEGKTVSDVVIGSRYVSGGGTVGWSWMRKIMSRCINAYARFWLWIPAHDTSGSYRNYAVNKLRALDFSRIQAKGYAFFEEILWRLRCAGATMSEVPILFEDRRLGQSKMNWRESLRAVWTLFWLRK